MPLAPGQRRRGTNLLTSHLNQAPSAFHPSGRYLVFEEFESETNKDLKALPIEGATFTAGKPRPWADGRIALRGPAKMFDLHPDGNRVILAPSPSPRDIDAMRLDKMVMVFNFFDELRRVAGGR